MDYCALAGLSTKNSSRRRSPFIIQDVRLPEPIATWHVEGRHIRGGRQQIRWMPQLVLRSTAYPVKAREKQEEEEEVLILDDLILLVPARFCYPSNLGTL